MAQGVGPHCPLEDFSLWTNRLKPRNVWGFLRTNYSGRMEKEEASRSAPWELTRVWQWVTEEKYGVLSGGGVQRSRRGQGYRQAVQDIDKVSSTPVAGSQWALRLFLRIMEAIWLQVCLHCHLKHKAWRSTVLLPVQYICINHSSTSQCVRVMCEEWRY